MELLVAVPVGFVLGFLIGLTGVGGGALVAPAIYVLLGRDYGEAVALSLIYSLFTKIFGAIQHTRQGTVLWRLTLLYGLAAVPGTIVGSRLVYAVGEDTQRIFPFLMAGILAIVAALMVMEAWVKTIAAWQKPFSPQDITWPAVVAIVLFQLLVGVLMGMTSVGAGSLVILSMVYLFRRMSAREIVGSNLVIALIMVVPAAVTHYLDGGVDWTLLLELLVGSLFGTVLGSRSAMLVSDHVLKLTIVVLVAVGAVSTVVKAW